MSGSGPLSLSTSPHSLAFSSHTTAKVYENAYDIRLGVYVQYVHTEKLGMILCAAVYSHWVSLLLCCGFFFSFIPLSSFITPMAENRQVQSAVGPFGDGKE